MGKYLPGKHLHRLLQITIMLLILTLTFTAHAQDNRTVFWQRWDVTIDKVDVTNNIFEVSEQYDVQFSGTFRFGSAVIPVDRIEVLDDIRVFEGGSELENNCSENPGTFCVDRSDGNVSITYYFNRAITNASQTFELRYRVIGALRSYEGGDQLWWIAIPQDKYGFSVGESTVTVDLPDGYAPREGVDPIEAYGVDATVRQNGSQIVATANTTIGPNDSLEIRVQYPHNPNLKVAKWQAAYDRQQEIKPLLDVGMIGLAVLIGLLGPLVVFYLWYSRGRDPKIGPVPEFLSELPSNLPPGVVGALVDEKADLRDVLCTLIDLSRRGHIVIEEDKREGLFGLGGGSDFSFKRTDLLPTEDFRSYERDFLTKFFGGSMTRTMDSLKNKFYVHIPVLQRALYQEMVREGLFKANPDDTRNGWSGLGVVVIIIAGVLGYLAYGVIDSLSFSLMLPPIAIGITGLALTIAGQSMPVKTRKGAEEAAKWKAFRNYLSNLEKYKNLEEAAPQFEIFLPYAVAFGMDKAWIRKFSKLTTMPVPTWYYPTYRGGRWSGGYHPGTPLPQGGGFPGDLARAGNGGLNDLAGGMSGGLESISNGLTGMLNSAGSVMTSRPQSSSSGGGFSGGGSHGGGSGGGSRGFG